MIRVTVLIDGGYLSKILQQNNTLVSSTAIDLLSHACVNAKTEILHKVLYYDCDSYQFPEEHELYKPPSPLLKEVRSLPYFAVRLGNLRYRGESKEGGAAFEQKGVDVQIALDIAQIIMSQKIERIILICGDTDLIPAMKFARIHDIEVVLIEIDTLKEDLHNHADIIREVSIKKLLKSGKLKHFTSLKNRARPITERNTQHRIARSPRKNTL